MDRPSETTEVVAAEDCLSTTIDGEAVILHESGGKYYGLNEVGTLVWELLDEPRTIAYLCEEITDRYEVEYAQCRDDVTEMVSELADNELVRLDMK